MNNQFEIALNSKLLGTQACGQIIEMNGIVPFLFSRENIRVHFALDSISSIEQRPTIYALDYQTQKKNITTYFYFLPIPV